MSRSHTDKQLTDQQINNILDAAERGEVWAKCQIALTMIEGGEEKYICAEDRLHGVYGYNYDSVEMGYWLPNEEKDALGHIRFGQHMLVEIGIDPRNKTVPELYHEAAQHGFAFAVDKMKQDNCEWLKDILLGKRKDSGFISR